MKLKIFKNNKKLLLLLLSPALVLGSMQVHAAPFSYDVSYNETIDNMIDQVSQRTLRGYVNDLSGENPTTVGGQTVTIKTRHTSRTAELAKAEQ